MSSAIDLIIYSVATMLGLVIVGVIVVWFIQDVTQKKHSVLRNYPVVGRLRYIFERRKYFRQYFSPATGMKCRSTVPRAAGYTKMPKTKAVWSVWLHQRFAPAWLDFCQCAFPIQEEDQLPTPSLHIGQGYCEYPFEAKSVINISGMSYGAIRNPLSARYHWGRPKQVAG